MSVTKCVGDSLTNTLILSHSVSNISVAVLICIYEQATKDQSFIEQKYEKKSPSAAFERFHLLNNQTRIEIVGNTESLYTY